MIKRGSTQEEVSNVFTPNSAVTVPAKFAGREEPLEEMINFLLTEGADLIIFGERGAGKSSIAQMLHSIAKGDLELLSYYGLREQLERKGFWSWLTGPTRKEYNVIWVDGFGRPIDEVLRSILLRRADGVSGPGLLSYLPKEADQVEVAAQIGVEKVISAGGEVSYTYTAEKPQNIKEGFETALQRYSEQYDKDLVIIIDEFETVTNKSEISQYLKSVRRARFALVGIAATTLELIGQHASVARDTHAIELLPMRDEELRLILQLGSYVLTNYCNYTEPAIDEIIHHCYGSPYWCHFMAKSLLQQKIESAGRFSQFMNLNITDSMVRQVRQEDVTSLLTGLPRQATCRIYEEALKQITMGDEITAKVLLGIARNQESVISSKSACDLLESDEQISRDITIETISGILQMKDSPLEERGRIRDIVSFSFRDPNFKRYILMRNASL